MFYGADESLLFRNFLREKGHFAFQFYHWTQWRQQLNLNMARQEQNTHRAVS